ncbi:MAG: hypothetical protein CBC35_02050 [Planctomycetes bacterium TMED75]|nr:hypothetical protein [Planctomycetaceae bacterium]OUU95949.1 MAG: hypothetical protein CBC35_02050 [Planctomycetes bacterium TMED75]
MQYTFLTGIGISLFIGALAVPGGCGRSDETIQDLKTADVVIPASTFVNVRPEGSVMLADIKASGNVGDKVVVEARVGGRATPFVDGSAMFIAADPRLVSCDQRPGDHCKIPYDYCCEDPAAMKAGTATIQLVDSNGIPYPVGARGQGGIEPLKTVVISGVISEKNEQGIMVIDGSTIWVGTIPASPPGEHDHHDHHHDHDHSHE